MSRTKSSTDKLGIVWFRQDLRLGDNPAWRAACSECTVVIPLFIDDPGEQTVSQLGAASSVWLHHSLMSHAANLVRHNNELVLMQGDPLAVLESLCDYLAGSVSADITVYWNRCYDPLTIRRDRLLKASLQQRVHVQSFNGLLLFEPWDTVKADGTPYRVFTPFYRKLAPQLPTVRPLAAPRTVPASAAVLAELPGRCTLEGLQLLPTLTWHSAMMQHWRVGETAAQQRLKEFIKNSVADYSMGRDVPAIDGTSRLSPHLHFGEISPRQIIQALFRHCEDINDHGSGAETMAREVVWREFAYQLLFHFPHTVNKPLDKRFAAFPWARKTKKTLGAWQQGKTGVPIIDAGMRQLWQTGWMHNRVRMIVGSYLVKNLLLDWRHGERWFRDTLVDADLASNVMGWQWVAGSGADAAPFFRVFNPILQGEKFDPDGEYVRRWVPELADVPNSHIHKPWTLLPELRPPAYPEPLVDLKESRARALLSFDQIKTPL